MDIHNLSVVELSLPLDSVDSRSFSFPLCESPQQDGKVKKKKKKDEMFVCSSLDVI